MLCRYLTIVPCCCKEYRIFQLGDVVERIPEISYSLWESVSKETRGVHNVENWHDSGHKIRYETFSPDLCLVNRKWEHG